MKIRTLMRFTMSTFLAVIVLFVSCASDRDVGLATTETNAQRSEAKAPPGAVELPREFGVYSESVRGLEPLMGTPKLAAKNPSFVVYLQELPPIEKLRLRFGKGGTNLFVIEYGEGAGVFEAKMEPVPDARVVTAVRRGVYDRFCLRFDPAHRRYDLRVEHDVDTI